MESFGTVPSMTLNCSSRTRSLLIPMFAFWLLRIVRLLYVAHRGAFLPTSPYHWLWKKSGGRPDHCQGFLAACHWRAIRRQFVDVSFYGLWLLWILLCPSALDPTFSQEESSYLTVCTLHVRTVWWIQQKIRSPWLHLQIWRFATVPWRQGWGRQ